MPWVLPSRAISPFDHPNLKPTSAGTVTQLLRRRVSEVGTSLLCFPQCAYYTEVELSPSHVLTRPFSLDSCAPCNVREV